MFDIFEYTNQGGHSYNEDSIGSSNEGSRGIFVVADGLGGHALGEEASAAAVNGDQAAWANVGDSRVYFIHRNNLHAYTNDHSVAFKKYKAGETTREQIASDEDQPRLLRSLGSEERNEPELYTADVPLEWGGCLLPVLGWRLGILNG